MSAAGPPAGLHPLVLDRLAAAAATAPILLIVEDVHWADRSTLELLAYLARRLGDERVLVVATYRSDEVDRHERLRRFLADVATAARAQRLALDRLSRAQTREQLAGILGEAPPEPLLDAVFARAEGNPFFAEELIAAAREGAEGLPPTLRDMLLARIHALDPRAQAVVRIAAAGGRDVHHRAAGGGRRAARARACPTRCATPCASTCSSRSTTATPSATRSFSEAAYGELLPGERARVHAAFAAALEARPDLAGGNTATVTAEIAHHWLRAGDDPRALAAAVRAGTEAERVGALAEAAEHDKRALALWERVRRRRAARGHRSRGAARPRGERGGLDGGCRRGHRACRCRDRAPRDGGRARARRGAPAAAGAVPVAARARARERARTSSAPSRCSPPTRPRPNAPRPSARLA